VWAHFLGFYALALALFGLLSQKIKNKKIKIAPKNNTLEILHSKYMLI